ncbi:MAG: hypothetical protein Tsb0033_28800 [Winogradskyella sp.]
MNKELKFRAWLESCKTMLEEITIYPDMIGLGVDSFENQLGSYEKGFEFDGEHVRTTDGNYKEVLSVLTGEDWVYIEPKNYKLMQLTGFKDSKGNDIYEGDILSDEVMTDEGLKMSLQQVFWDDKKGCWMLDFSHKQNKSSSDMLYSQLLAYDYKIVGNIYENSKLISHDKM